jgi:hypothetical protein
MLCRIDRILWRAPAHSARPVQAAEREAHRARALSACPFGRRVEGECLLQAAPHQHWHKFRVSSAGATAFIGSERRQWRRHPCTPLIASASSITYSTSMGQWRRRRPCTPAAPVNGTSSITTPAPPGFRVFILVTNDDPEHEDVWSLALHKRPNVSLRVGKAVDVHTKRFQSVQASRTTSAVAPAQEGG